MKKWISDKKKVNNEFKFKVVTESNESGEILVRVSGPLTERETGKLHFSIIKHLRTLCENVDEEKQLQLIKEGEAVIGKTI